MLENQRCRSRRLPMMFCTEVAQARLSNPLQSATSLVVPCCRCRKCRPPTMFRTELTAAKQRQPPRYAVSSHRQACGNPWPPPQQRMPPLELSNPRQARIHAAATNCSLPRPMKSNITKAELGLKRRCLQEGHDAKGAAIVRPRTGQGFTQRTLVHQEWGSNMTPPPGRMTP